MTQVQLEKFVHYLQKENWLVFGPVQSSEVSAKTIEEISPYLIAHQMPKIPKKEKGLVLIKQIQNPSELLLNECLPFFSFKRFFVPEGETLFEYQGTKLKSFLYFPPLVKGGEGGFKKIALLGVNILDLKAVNLYDQVFGKDPYYQARRRNILIIGHSLVPEIEDNIFEYKYEEDILEHLPFDIFLVNSNPPTPLLKGGTGGVKVFSGSIKGQRILEHFGYKNYQHIQFSGPVNPRTKFGVGVKEGEPEERMVLLRDKLKNHHNQKMWDELGKRCIECGKCTIVCPTCFCFRIDDYAGLEDRSGARQRCWDSCYYQEFSEVAGGGKFLRNTAQRIHFWYFHKFARIPDEFDFMGCVGCHRCTAVCPVGIDIAEVLKNIENSQ
ncbi:MAG: 4Fe-4S ferredoxin [Parcubacteria group bacterium LiPW_39]|nr:MAG: 4Fe-4S ferredoxin [Parcubacteria group bacterium LiPW_39]